MVGWNADEDDHGLLLEQAERCRGRRGSKMACRVIVGETSKQLKTVMWSCCNHSKSIGKPRSKYSKPASDHVHIEKNVTPTFRKRSGRCFG